MDTVEESSHTSSMVDDTFYIVKKCVRYVQTCLSLEKWCTLIIYFTWKIINVFCDLLIHCIANIELFGVKKKTVLFSGACWITYSLIVLSQTQISWIHLICQNELKTPIYYFILFFNLNIPSLPIYQGFFLSPLEYGKKRFDCSSLWFQEGSIELQRGWDLCNVEPCQHRARTGLQRSAVFPGAGGVPLRFWSHPSL